MGEEDFPLLMLKLTVFGLCFFVLQLFLPGLPAYTLAAGIVGVLAGYLAGSPWRGVTSALFATAQGTILILCLNYRMFVGPSEGQLEELSFWASFAEAFVIAGMVAALTGAAAGAIAERQCARSTIGWWPGLSGKQYKCGIAPIGTVLSEEPGNYIFAKETKPGYWLPCYIGQTDNLNVRLGDHEKEACAKRHGATHIHSHTAPGGEAIRKAEEKDLVQRWKPPCNEQLT